MRSRRRVLGLVLTMSMALTMALTGLMSAKPTLGHGWVTGPPSRQDNCAKGRTSFDCGAVKYEPQSVEAPKGSMLCSGGGSFSILNDDSRPWPVASVGSSITIQWQLTAAHRTSTWEYFVDGRLHATFNQGGTQPPSNISHTISGLPSGRHKILARWNIYDTVNAFYNCIDVNVGGSGGTLPTATRTRTPTSGGGGTAPTATRVPTTPSGTTTWAPNRYYATGSTVTYNGVNYRCLQAHTSQTGWEPPNVPALWQRI